MRLHPRAPVLFAVPCLALALVLSCSPSRAQAPPPFRPPAVPLVTCDPYFSVWSMSDSLTGDWPRHWTGATNAFDCMARIDGNTYRLMGMEPGSVPSMHQASLNVFPTRTVYEFEAGGVHITLTFLTPLLPEDLDILSRPVTYLTWDVRSADLRGHAVSLYFDATAELAVNTSDQKVIWSRGRTPGLTVLQMGSQEQPVLAKSGDDLRIDWGYFLVAASAPSGVSDAMTDEKTARATFASSGVLPPGDNLRMPRAASDEWPVLALAFDLGQVGREAVSRHIILAYDDRYSIEYLDRKLRPYWRRDGAETEQLLSRAADSYADLNPRCRAFDEELVRDLVSAGGERYARLAVLAYRQCIAAHKLAVDIDGTPLFFPKENFSNGCISTVDVLYPSSPLMLLFNTKLLKAALTPVLEYARSPRWTHPYAPHDLGTYPLADGQVYGGGERSDENQMPVEECGNMLIMMAAMAHADGHPDYALKYWPLLSTWAGYLKEKGLDPENQLCTDDFAGHLAHNANLSVKAILALGGYAMMCDMAGKKKEAEGYRALAKNFASRWQESAADGDHYRLAFDRPGTWSQKYNLVWDDLLGLGLFPREVKQREIRYYLTKQAQYGLPLDNRKEWTKLDWLVWTATLASSRADFEALIAPAYEFAQHSPSRVPLTDWYWTTDAKQVGFQARSVVGGLFLPVLADRELWKKWCGRAR